MSGWVSEVELRRRKVRRGNASTGQPVLVVEKDTGLAFPAFLVSFGARRVKVRSVDNSWHDYGVTEVGLFHREP